MQEKCEIINPYDIGEIPQQTKIVNLNYTNQDFYSMKARLIAFIKEKFGNDFNDFVESSLAIMLIENFAFIADTLSFKIDQIANEVFIDTVTELDNAFRLAKLVGLKPLGPIGSKALFTGRITNIQSIDLVIEAPFDFSIVSNGQQIFYELYPADSLNRPIYDEPIVIKAGNLINSNIVGVAGKTTTNFYTSTGEINQVLVLNYSSIINDSVRVFIDGQEWLEVDFFTSGIANKEFIVEYNSDYSVNIIFGNGQGGLVPSLGTKITVEFRIGGSPNGDIVTNYANVETLVNPEGLAISVPVNFTNYTAGQFGYSGDTVEDIREKIPLYLRTQNRAVSGQDYKSFGNYFTTNFNGVMGKCNPVLRNYGCAANIIDYYILVRQAENGLQPASSQFKAELMDALDDIKMFTDSICLKDGEIVLVDVLIEVTIDRFYKKFEDELRASMIAKINGFFNLNNWDYGEYLNDVDIIQALSDFKQPKAFDISINTISESNLKIVTTKYYEIIRPENISISFIYV